MVVHEITLEPYFDEDGTLLVREKESKKMVGGLLSVDVSESTDRFQELTLKVIVCTDRFSKQIEDIKNGKA